MNRYWWLVLWASGCLIAACGSSSDQVAAQGGEGQDCYPNLTCNTGLSCVSQLCVDADAATDGGSADAGATDADTSSPDVGTDAANACPPGYLLDGLMCVGSAPRPIAPLSTSTVTSQTPTFHWTFPLGTVRAKWVQLEVCQDRAFTSMCQVSLIDSGATKGSLANPLTPGLWYWRLQSIEGETPVGPSSHIWEFTVGNKSASVDSSWGTTPDVNGDGYPDLLVGASNANGGAGAVHVYLGSASGFSNLSAPITLTPPSIDLAPHGPATFTAVNAGDINGDGFADILVGVAVDNLNNTTVGAVYLYLGAAGFTSFIAPITVTTPSADGTDSSFGSSVASAGDVNGDGFADVVVGAPGVGNVGAVHVYLGAAGSNGFSNAATPITLTPPAADGTGAGFGFSVANAGDLNGDGFADVVVGANTANSQNGAVHVYLGAPSGFSNAATPITLTPPAADGTTPGFGSPVASAGDVNGDGFADVLVGALENGGIVQVYLGVAGSKGFSNAATPIILTPPAADGATPSFGSSLASAGDVNGDGFADVLVGASEVNAYDGAVHLYLGAATGFSNAATPITLTPPAADGASPFFGTSVASAGDVNGDGLADVLVGASQANAYVGAVHVYLGAANGFSNAATPISLTPPVSDGATPFFGSSVASAGDVNGGGACPQCAAHVAVSGCRFL